MSDHAQTESIDEFQHHHEHGAGHPHNHKHEPVHVHGHDHGPHGHTHGVIDPSLATTARGLWAVKWSFVGLMTTAVLQLVVVVLSGSVALMADTIHNFADAATAIPLGIAFLLARLPATRRFPYGYGRAEDLAGLAIVGIIFFSAVVAGYESISRLIHPRAIDHLAAVAIASVIGFLGNEAVAVFRIRVGKEINSVALIADGYHARTDGWTSLAVLVGAFGVWFGYPLADPLVGLLITLAIAFIVWQSSVAVVVRAMDGVDPKILRELEHSALHVEGVTAVPDVRARWVGHRLHAELSVSLDGALTAEDVRARLAEVDEEVHEHLPSVARTVVTLHS